MIVTLQACASTAKVYASHSVTAMLEIMAIHELSKTMYNMGYRSIHEYVSVTNCVPYRKASIKEKASSVPRLYNLATQG